MGFFAQGFQDLIDGQQRYMRSGLQAFLRVQNFPPTGDFQEVGVPYAPSGSAQVGFTDVLIDPPPEVKPMSIHNIGMSNGKLMFGATEFRISGTFVDNLRQKYPEISDAYGAFRYWDGGVNTNPGDQTAAVEGIVYGNWMYSIEDIGRRVIGGRTVLWILKCNAHELYLPAASAEPEPHDQQL